MIFTLPLKDDVESSTFPIINYLLIFTNVLIFLYQLSLGNDVNSLYVIFSVVPYHLIYYYGPLELVIRLTATMFLHGGWFHLLGNMLYLWIFGDNIEDRMGHGRYIVFYLLCGYIATFAHVLATPQSTAPIIGASGAIAGILGAYLVLYPRAKVLTLFPIGIFISIIRIPAVLLLGLWFLLQMANQFLVTSVSSQSVAWWAHIGGFLAGVLLIKLFAKRKTYLY